MGCNPIDETLLRYWNLSSGTGCLCDSGNECNKVPCTDEDIRPDGKMTEEKDAIDAVDGGGGTMHGSWLCLMAIGNFLSLAILSLINFWISYIFIVSSRLQICTQKPSIGTLYCLSSLTSFINLYYLPQISKKSCCCFCSSCCSCTVVLV